MPAYKNQKTGEWYCIFRVTDWTGKRKQIKKSCFARRADALAYEREYLAKSSRTTKMKFGSLVELYMADAKTRLRPTTYEMKQWIFETKILPYFKDQLVDEVSVSSIRAWQNHLIDARDKNGKPYSATYLKTINNQMSALFRFAGKYYGLKENPVSLAGSMGKSSAEEMQFWTLEEFQKFIAGMSDPTAYAAFNILFWTGMREGELLALTLADVDFERKGIFVRHSYARLNGEDVISDPKTRRSKRFITVPDFLLEIIREYAAKLYEYQPEERLFECTKYWLKEQWVIDTPKRDYEGGFIAMKEIIEGKDYPSIMFISMPQQVIGTLNACQKAGVRIPDDMEILAYGTYNYFNYLSPTISCVYLPMECLAQTALDLLMTVLDKNIQMPINRILHEEYCFRESCGGFIE